MANLKVEMIGRGTWLDMVAHRVIEREEELERHVDVLRTESGLAHQVFHTSAA
ncbi:MAG TPA: hypothetical protein VEG61_07535 [Candidatus Dormibacteraeota bacterium]|nr:hypothetical protein [Candidatus Dormibacteraeota bacterium]